MQKNILITGKPRSGKSTLLNKLIKDIPNKKGFVTNEIPGEINRLGFEIVTHTGNKTILAHVDFKTGIQVSRYFIDVKNLDQIIPEVSEIEDGELLYLDEIGQMELFSAEFKELVLKYLDSENTTISTFSCVYEDDFMNAIKNRDDVLLVEITEENRAEKEVFIRQLLEDLK